jgi:hypothetical protein
MGVNVPPASVHRLSSGTSSEHTEAPLGISSEQHDSVSTASGHTPGVIEHTLPGLCATDSHTLGIAVQYALQSAAVTFSRHAKRGPKKLATNSTQHEPGTSGGEGGAGVDVLAVTATSTVMPRTPQQ